MKKEFVLSAVFRAVNKLSRPVGAMSRSVSRFSKSAEKNLRKVDRAMSGVNRSVKKVAASTAAAGAAVGLVGRSVVLTGSEFEQAITNVGAVSLRTRDEIAALEKTALSLGATTKFTATEAAEAMEVMAKAGFSNQEILAGIEPVLSATAASGLEMAEVAGHVSNALKGMGLEASEAGRVADVLALASSKTNSTIGSLGEGLSNVASTARQFGIPLEDTVAAIALLQDVGLDASVSGSSLNTMLTKMAKPTAAIVAQMKDLGVSFEDTNGNMLPFSEVLLSLSKAARESGGNLKVVEFFADLVGLRGQKAAINLKDLFNSGKSGTLTRELNEATNTSKEMASIRLDTLQGDWELLGSAVDGYKISLFDTKNGALRGLVQDTTKWVSSLSGNAQVTRFLENVGDLMSTAKVAVSGLGDGFDEFVKALLGAKDGESTLESINGHLFWLASFFKSNESTVRWVARVTGAFAGLWLIMFVITKVLPIIMGGFSLITAVLKGLWFVVVLVVKAIAAIVAAIGIVPFLIAAAVIGAGILIWAYWDELKATSVVVAKWVGKQWGKAAKFMSKAWRKAKEGLFSIWDSMKTKAAEAFEWISNKAKSALGWAVNMVSKIGSMLGGDSSSLGGEFSFSGDTQSSAPAPQAPTFTSSESVSRTESTLTIEDRTGSAVLSGSTSAPGMSLNLQSSGAL